MTDDYIEPGFQTRPYRLRDVVFLRDRRQQYIYLTWGVIPVDMYVSSDRDLVMVFRKDETRELYEKYRNGELEPKYE